MNKRRVAIGFLGNFMYDTRTYNLRAVLMENGVDVRFAGFDWLTADFRTENSDTVYIRKLNKSVLSLLFYLQFAILLFFRLLKFRADIYWAADFYSLPCCYLASRFTGAALYYDAREIYTGVRGIATRPVLKKLVFTLERILIARSQAVFVTGTLDAAVMNSLYSIPNIYLLRNLPRYQTQGNPFDYTSVFNTAEKSLILLYQGTLVHGRGIPFYFDAVKQMDSLLLVLLGGGEHEDEFRRIVRELNIDDRVFFAGKITQDRLFDYTSGADIGLAVIDNISQNNELALPNKLFEYIMAGIPVIASNLPQMAEIVEQYHVGAVIEENNLHKCLDILHMWEKQSEMIQKMKKNCLKASCLLNWEAEFETISHLFR